MTSEDLSCLGLFHEPADRMIKARSYRLYRSSFYSTTRRKSHAASHSLPAFQSPCSRLCSPTSAALAQYASTNLDSDLSGKAKQTDPLLKNGWGLAYAPGGAFWVSDEASGWSTLYDGKGNIQSLKVVIPSSTGSGAGSPTGMVYNAFAGVQDRQLGLGISVLHARRNHSRLVAILIPARL